MGVSEHSGYLIFGVLRLVPKILHDFQHLHGFPAPLNFNIALTHRLEKGLARMP